MKCIDLVQELLSLRNSIKTARSAYEHNRLRAQDLHNTRCDLEHQMEMCKEEDPTKRMLSLASLAAQYSETARQRHDLLNENRAFEALLNNRSFEYELDRILELMTGQLQFPEHAEYRPRICAGGGTLNADSDSEPSPKDQE